jgi:mono/diheme cytochrome c family protein
MISMHSIGCRFFMIGAIALFSGPVFAQDMGGPVGAVKAREPITGEEIFHQVCQACHQQDAKGATGAATIPALAKNPHLAEPGFVIGMITNGRGGMPPLHLTPDQAAAITNYVRTHFGNHYGKPVTAADVKLMTGE